MSPDMADVMVLAKQNVEQTLRSCFDMKPSDPVLVVFDQASSLSRILVEAYRSLLPWGEFLDFDATSPELIRARIDAQPKGALVILIQATNFRLNEFRFRIELFQRGLRTIEHVHLSRMTEEQEPAYLASLGYDEAYYQRFGRGLKAHIDKAKRTVVRCPGTELVYDGPMEPAKLNIGDYRGLENIGGTFPIGEVFSEPTDLSCVNGEAKIFAFAGMDHQVNVYEPFLVQIKQGILTAPDAPELFQQILDMIRVDEPVHVREFGLGLNRAFGKHQLVNDVTAFERQAGLHLSLGAKHGVYRKPGFTPKHTRYHVDVFVDVEQIEMDGVDVYRDGSFVLL